MEGIRARPATDADLEFLYRVYADTRREELSVLDWSDAQKAEFLRMQFSAQHQHYTTHHPDSSFQVLERGGVPIGRLYVDRRSDDIRVMEIALLGEFCGQGIGGALMREIQYEAEAEGKTVSIHVEQNNPAIGLYRRLGFREIGEEGIYYLMEWRPTAQLNTAS